MGFVFGPGVWVWLENLEAASGGAVVAIANFSVAVSTVSTCL
jgi:hypothetical protein